MKAAAKITIYVPCRNYGRYLQQCLSSIAAQTIPDWELIVFDEGSEDNTREIARQFRQGREERVQIIEHDDPKGLRACANQALDMARGTYIMRVDADDFIDENAILILKQYLDQHPEIGLVYPNWIYVSEQGDVLGVETRKKVGSEAEVLDLPAHGACTMIRKRVLKAIGGYETDFDSQDGHEVWMKTLHQFGVGNVRTPLFYYRKHGNSMSSDAQRMLEGRRAIKSRMASRMRGPVKPRIAAILPVKNTYPHLPNIALEPLAGRPLIDYTLDTILAVDAFDTCLVAADDEAVLSHCRNISGVHTHLRDAHLSDPEVHLPEVIEEAVEFLEREHDIHPDIVVMLNVHCPLTQPEHIREALDTLLVYNVDQVLSTYEDQELHFRHGRSGLEAMNIGALRGLRLEREALYTWNGSIQVMWRDVLRDRSLFAGRVSHIVMSKVDSMQAKHSLERDQVARLIEAREAGHGAVTQESAE